MKNLEPWVAAVGATVSLSALADSPVLEPLIVTATRTPAAPSELLASVEVISGEELSRLPRESRPLEVDGCRRRGFR